MKGSPSTIASTVYDTFQTLMLWDLDRYRKTTPELFELINLPLAQSVTARNALGDRDKRQSAGDRDHAIRRRAAVRPLPLREFRASAAAAVLTAFGPLHRHGSRRMVQFVSLRLEVPEYH